MRTDELLKAYLRLEAEVRPPALTTNAVPLPLPAPPDAETLMRSTRELEALRKPPMPALFGISRRSITPTGGLRIVEDPHMTDTVEDWSEVRSPSRAARRRRQGYRQRIRWVERPKSEIYHVGDMLVMHPETARVFREKVAAAGDDMVRRAEREMFGAVLGGL